MRRTLIVPLCIGLGMLAGCANTYDPGQRALGGGLLGGAGGAAVGGLAGGGKGALIGGGVGAAGGALAGAATTPEPRYNNYNNYNNNGYPTSGYGSSYPSSGYGYSRY